MKNNRNIIVTTLEKYNKKYRNHKDKLLKLTKKEVEEYDKLNNTTNKLLDGHKWALIGDAYYEIPKTFSLTWFRNLSVGLQAGICVLGAGVVATAVAVPLVVMNQNKPVSKEEGTPTKVDEEGWDKAIAYVTDENRNFSATTNFMNLEMKFKMDKNLSFYNYYDPDLKTDLQGYSTKVGSNCFIEQDANGKVTSLANSDANFEYVVYMADSLRGRYKDFKDSYNEKEEKYFKNESIEDPEYGISMNVTYNIKFVNLNNNIYLKDLYYEVSSTGEGTFSHTHANFYDFNKTVINIPAASNIVTKQEFSAGGIYSFESRKYDNENKNYLYKIKLNDNFEENKYLKITLNNRDSGQQTNSLLNAMFAINGVYKDFSYVEEDGAIYINNSEFEPSGENELYLLTTCKDETNDDLNCVITLNAEKESGIKTVNTSGDSLQKCFDSMGLNITVDSYTPYINDDNKTMAIYYNNPDGQVALNFNIKNVREDKIVQKVKIEFEKTAEEAIEVTFDLSEAFDNSLDGDTLEFTL